jgi:PhnB protein
MSQITPTTSFSHTFSSELPSYLRSTKTDTMQIHPYLYFSGDCREAFTYYRQCLGGELTLQTVGDSPMAAQWPEQVHHHVLHAMLATESFTLLGTDMTEIDLPPVIGSPVALSVTCRTRKELETVFAALAENGQVLRPLHDFFGGTLGYIADPYGKEWLFFYRNRLTDFRLIDKRL